MGRLQLILMLVLGLVATCDANSVLYETVGDEVVLSSGPVTGTITSMKWTHNRNIIAYWFGNEPKFHEPFKGRCKLNTATGELTISNLTREDSGNYRVEINKKVLNTTELSVISVVPTPTISTSCDDQMTHCVLTCEVNTTDSGPVTYYWLSGGVVMKSETKELNITKKEKEDSFVCMVKNPVSSESSKEVLNPFINKNLKPIIIAVVLILLGVGVGVGLFLWKRKCKGSQVNLPTNGAVQESSSQGPTSSVHLENETETVNDPLIGVNNDADEKAAEKDISRIDKLIQKAGHIINGELETIV